jgi:uncharacterized membrane protein
MPLIGVIGLFFHILAAVIWVGGMFFAHQLLRPAAAALEPVHRLPLWRRVFARFFPLVWLSIAALVASGYAMVFGVFGGFARLPLHIDLMQLIGIIMMLAFGHLYFAPGRVSAARSMPAISPPEPSSSTGCARSLASISCSG